MAYTVTFYALRPGLAETVVATHRVEPLALAAYTSTPGITLAAMRSGRADRQVDGFRVVCPAGKVVLDYVDRPGQG